MRTACRTVAEAGTDSSPAVRLQESDGRHHSPHRPRATRARARESACAAVCASAFLFVDMLIIIITAVGSAALLASPSTSAPPPLLVLHHTRHAPVRCAVRKHLLRRVSDKTFEETVSSGGIGADPTECYAMVMRTYVYLNRWASVDPPSRALIEQAVADADLDRSGKLDRGEFRRLVSILAANAMARVLATVVVNVVVCPVLALILAARLADMSWWTSTATLMAQLLPLRVRPSGGSAALLRATLTLIFAYTIGDVLLRAAIAAIDRMRLRRAFVRGPTSDAYRRMRRMQSGHARRVREALGKVAEFRALTDAQRHELQRAMRTQAFEAGDAVFRQGDEGDDFYVIVRGSAEVRRVDAPCESAAPARERLLARIGEGACFGERALLTRGRRYASVVATSPLVTLRLSRDEFELRIGRLADFLGT